MKNATVFLVYDGGGNMRNSIQADSSKLFFTRKEAEQYITEQTKADREDVAGYLNKYTEEEIMEHFMRYEVDNMEDFLDKVYGNPWKIKELQKPCLF